MGLLTSFPILHTERLTLRSISTSDLVPMIEVAGFKIEVPTEKDALAYIRKTDHDFDQGNGITWAIDLRGEMIGTIGYYRGFADKTGEIGYVMCAAHKRKGYMREAAQAAVDFGFQTLGLERITAFTEISNAPSVRLLQTLGFTNTVQQHEKYTIFDIIAHGKT